MVIAALKLFPLRDQRRQVLGILRAFQGPTRVQAHCLACEVYEEAGYEAAVLYLERWDSEPAFHRHVRSDRYRQLLEAIELSAQSPEICFHQVSGTRGLDLLEQLRAPEKSPENLGTAPHTN